VITAGESADELIAVDAAARAAGVRCVMMDALQVRDLEPLVTPAVAAGAFIPDHGVVVPASLSQALTKAAATRGANFETDQVERVVPCEGGGFGVQTSRKRFRARRVVVAGGSWSGQLAIEGIPRLPVRPVRGQLMHLTSPGPSLRRVIWGSGCYIVPSLAGPLSIGATMEEAGFDERVTVAAVRQLLGAAAELLPALCQAGFTGARVGLRPATPDQMPIMGRSQKFPGLFYATGHFRNGILLAPLTGRVLADLVLENREDTVLETTSPQRFGEY
jgi:glycine oxidase